MGSQGPALFDVKRIAIIGAGPCGLSAAKYLAAQKAFESIVVFEQQSEVGGVWNYSPKASSTLHVPQVSASIPPDPPIEPEGTAPVFPSPMYQVLHTNIPRALMRFSDLPFPEDSLIFPTREAVQDYLVAYARDIRHLIKFSTQVLDVRLRQGETGKDQWDVDVRSLMTGEITSATYDAVVVASGHYSIIYIPEIKNAAQFHKTYPGIISHSKLYRNSESFADKKVVVVGNAASGLDIAAQISRVCQQLLLLSVRTPTPPANLAHVGAEEVSLIEEFLVSERGIRFQDGRVEKDVDAVIFATGYLFSFPFLASFNPPLISNGRQVNGLYKDLFQMDHPTLVFPGLPIKVVPFPLSESQAAIFSRTWANLLPLPPLEEMKRWEREEAGKRGLSYHVWPKGGDAEFINAVHDWISQSKTAGKEPPHWDDEQIWERKIYFEAKLKFEIEGRSAKSLEELGFQYRPDEWENPAPEIL
ncbi:FAD/NAD(P)-binding domain-containing protein [Podospora didyma]|uniref:FAD/NAD(P)-binding domain-containing protein n=1 Tax=Podospora didyma TaxID=330526 RepID=A0AAE0KJP9_9PEZI|nr:FAD/NAD(P)-binding domain-containing protein [Podospora didyma]